MKCRVLREAAICALAGFMLLGSAGCGTGHEKLRTREVVGSWVGDGEARVRFHANGRFEMSGPPECVRLQLHQASPGEWAAFREGGPGNGSRKPQLCRDAQLRGRGIVFGFSSGSAERQRGGRSSGDVFRRERGQGVWIRDPARGPVTQPPSITARRRRKSGRRARHAQEAIGVSGEGPPHFTGNVGSGPGCRPARRGGAPSRRSVRELVQSWRAPMRRSQERTSASASRTFSPRTASPSPTVAPGQDAA